MPTTPTEVMSPPPCEESRDAVAWKQTITHYKRPDLRKSWTQIANTFVPAAALLGLMVFTAPRWPLLTLLLGVPAAGLLVRIFILMHDCGHGSFFRSRAANDWLGFLCGVFAATPYQLWRRTHALHHTTNGNLSHRGYGDIVTLTVEEYQNRSLWGRFLYRAYRHPLVLFGIGPIYFFLIHQRLTLGVPRNWRRERRCVHATNLCVLGLLALGYFTIGLPAVLLIWLPAAALGAAVGSWLFFIQHQFEDTYWQPQQSWDFTDAALQGSSYYRLPAVLQWFTGNIGFHHIHHLNSRIPNYHLEACHDAEPEFRKAVTIGLWDGWRCVSLKLWDAKQQRLIGFAEARRQAA